MKTKEEMIEKMAAPIHEGNSCTSWESANIMAEAALKALCKALPVHYEQSFAADKYNQLLEWGDDE